MAVNIDFLNANNSNNINTNFQRVKEALQEVLGRDGDNPNHMNADLDMNSNDILNTNLIEAVNIIVDGEDIHDINGAKGWSPVYGAVEYNGSVIMQLVDYVGGNGEKPTDNIGDYVGNDGYVTDPSNAINFGGTPVVDGDKGDIIVSNNGSTWMLDDNIVDTNTLVDESITLSKIDPSVFLSLSKVCYTMSELKSLDTTQYNMAYLAEPGKEGVFVWDSSDLSGTLVRATLSGTTNSSGEYFGLASALTTSINDTTNVITISGGVPFLEDQEITSLSTINGLVAQGRYFAYNVTATTLQVRTSLTATALDLTGTTNFTLAVPHNLWDGYAVTPTTTALGLVAGTKYYIRKRDASTFFFNTAFVDTRATAPTNLVNIDAGSITIVHLADPLEGRFIIPTGDSIDGSDGAWVRQDSVLNSKHFGAKGDKSTDDGHPLQASVWLGAWLRMPTYTPAGWYMTSTSIDYKTNVWVNSPNQSTIYGNLENPDNGIVWRGDGQELTIIQANSSFLNSNYLVKFDGNPNAVSRIVGSRPMAQGRHLWENMQLYGRGRSVGTDVRAVFVRGVWGQDWNYVGIREFSGDFITVGSGAPAGPPNYDEVDNTGFWTMRGCQWYEGNKSAFVSTAVRIANVLFDRCAFRRFNDYGIQGTLAYSSIKGCNFVTIGNRSVNTTGAIRLVDSASGSQCRTVEITDNNVFENNFNHDIDLVQCRGAVIQGNSFHTMLPTGGVVSGKASVKIRSAGTDVTHDIIVEGNRWPDYSAPSDGSKYDVPNISIASGVEGVTWIMNVPSNTTETHITAASPVRLHIIGIDSSAVVTLTGSAPVDSFQNYVAL